ncbi:MAG: glycoside hydrolase, partial [Planctomycetia bacterium]|nr:glycoside hydrolase [Planctomycetia bacterium]
MQRVAVIIFLSVCISAGYLGSNVSEAEPPTAPQRTDVFVGGRDGYPVYRIPALLVTTKGTLLAMAEGRARLKDIAENDLVLKRSTDGGRTWGPLIVAAEDGDNSLNNPLLVVVRPSGRILLMYQCYPAHTGEAKVVAGIDGNKICRTLLQQSDDDGLTWSAPREITASVKRPTKVTS